MTQIPRKAICAENHSFLTFLALFGIIIVSYKTFAIDWVTAGMEVNMKRQSNQVTVLYCRIDRGGCPVHALEIIQKQQRLLLCYAQENNLLNPRVFSDCGFSGTNASRPQFQHIMQEIKAGNVSALVVKDTGRLFRGCLDAAVFIEKILPQYGVAFHSLDEGYRPILPLYKMICERGGRW